MSKKGQGEFGVLRSLNATGGGIRPYEHLKRWAARRERASRILRTVGGAVLRPVDRLAKTTSDKRQFPSGRSSMRSMRSVWGGPCLYHSGVDLDHIIRLGSWISSNFAIFLQSEGEILRTPKPVWRSATAQRHSYERVRIADARSFPTNVEICYESSPTQRGRSTCRPPNRASVEYLRRREERRRIDEDQV